jgi:sugar/nucleoside kinase (ribokinase family)
MKYDVYGIGNALVDVQSQVTDETLAQTGFDKGIMTLVDNDKQQALLGQLDADSFNRCAGGSAANTIVGIAEFGGRVAYCGKVGNDSMGEFFLEDMRALGVSIETTPATEDPTGTCAILITPDAQRTMLTNLGASGILAADDIIESEVQQSRYIYIEGYLLCGPATRSAAYRAIELAQKHDVKIAFTASDPFLVNTNRDEIWELVEGPVDMFFCNEEEARSLTGKEDAIDCAQEIHQHCENVALTLGANGSILMHGGQVIPIEGVNVEAVDTTGAGDMYAGGLLYGITNGMDWQQAGKLASHAAARVVSQMGARLQNKFTEEEIKTITE